MNDTSGVPTPVHPIATNPDRLAVGSDVDDPPSVDRVPLPGEPAELVDGAAVACPLPPPHPATTNTPAKQPSTNRKHVSREIL